MIAADLFGGQYVEGVKTGQQWKISDLYVGTRQDQDALDFIASFSELRPLSTPTSSITSQMRKKSSAFLAANRGVRSQLSK